MRRATLFASVIFAAAMPLFSTALYADADAAKGYVKEAQDALDRNEPDTVKSKLELAETELDGVDAAAKAPIADQIKEIRSKLADSAAAGDKIKYTRNITNALTDTEESIGNLATWPGAANKLTDLLEDARAKEVVPDLVASSAKKFATFKKLNAKKTVVVYNQYGEDAVKQAEDQWADSKKVYTSPDSGPGDKDTATNTMQTKLDDARKELTDQPPEEETAKALTARLDKISAEFTKIALADKVKAVADRLKSNFELYKDDWDGYDKETTGPTWAAYRKEQSDKMSAFFAPKTKVFVQRTTDLLANLSENEDYKAVQSDDSIKAQIADYTAKRDAASARLIGFVKAVVDDAVKAPIDDPSDWKKLKDDVMVSLGDKTPNGAALQDQLQKKIDAQSQAAAGADADRTKLIETLRSKANDAWPTLKDGFDIVVDRDMTKPETLVGKNITFTADNLMGWRYKPGDFYYATTVSGTPVAAKIDPAMLAQIKATEKAIGRSLGDDDSDGKWEIIATITDRHTKLIEHKQSESNGTVDNVNVKLTTNYTEPVDAVVIQIIAAKCGPFAGAKGKGVLRTDGTIGN